MMRARRWWCAQIQDEGLAMASQPTAVFREETTLWASLGQPMRSCPEELSTIYMDHYGHVLRVCRRFFRHREDAEDAAAEVFLKLYGILETRDETLPFRPWVSTVAGIALISCDEENARNVRPWRKRTSAESPTLQFLRHSPKF